MILLRKLYSSPEVFTPIVFEKGINLIIGDKSENNDKTNGVGKSVCIEFINFCLLKDKTHSRVMLIDDDTIPASTQIKLDLELFGEPITLSRSKESPDKPKLFSAKRNIEFESLDDALKYLNESINHLSPNNEETPSFREFMSLLARDEKSEFQNILKCYDVNKKAPENLVPHLFLLGLDLTSYKEIKKIINEISESTDYIRKVTSSILDFYPGKDLDTIRSELNSLQDEISKISSAIEELNTIESLKGVQQDIINLEDSIDQLRYRQQAIRTQISKIELVPKFEAIPASDIETLYNQFKAGLGTHLKKSIDEVQEFKTKIDQFQSNILSEKLVSLKNDLSGIEAQIAERSATLKETTKSISHTGILRNLKNSLSVYDKKNADASKIRSLFIELDNEAKKKQRLLSLKSSKIIDYDLNIESNDDRISSFERTILEIHEFIMGDKKASFRITTEDKATKKEFVNIEYRIKDDGSHSVDRAKVFIYDIAMLVNEYTNKRHPNFLIHDNIFDVDQDTMVKSLNYLNVLKNKFPFQYILTLNRDKIENEEAQKLINLNITQHTRETFTKDKRLLKKAYQERMKGTPKK